MGYSKINLKEIVSGMTCSTLHSHKCSLNPGCPYTSHYQHLPGETLAFYTRSAKAAWIDHHLFSNSSWFPGPQKGPACAFLRKGHPHPQSFHSVQQEGFGKGLL